MESLIGLLPLGLFALVCPLVMLVMMRGMMGGHGRNDHNAASNPEPDERVATRLVAMEREIKRLRDEPGAADSARTAARAGNEGRT